MAPVGLSCFGAPVNSVVWSPAAIMTHRVPYCSFKAPLADLPRAGLHKGLCYALKLFQLAETMLPSIGHSQQGCSEHPSLVTVLSCKAQPLGHCPSICPAAVDAVSLKFPLRLHKKHPVGSKSTSPYLAPGLRLPFHFSLVTAVCWI